MANDETLFASQAEANAFITGVKTPIQWREGGDPKNPARFWKDMGLDALILSTPSHLGQPQEVAREVYHRLVARFVASHVHKQQQAAIGRALAISFLGPVVLLGVTALAPSLVSLIEEGPLGGLLSSGIAKVLPLARILAYFGTPVILAGYASQMLAGASGRMCPADLLAQYKKDAGDAVNRCFLKGFHPDTPADLADVWRHGWLTSEGRPISSEIVETDATSLVALEVADGWISTAKAIRLMALFSLVPCFSFFLAPLLALLNLRGKMSPGRLRAMELDRRQAVEGPLLVAAGGINWAKHQETAWELQIEEALRDPTPILHLGEATGILAGRGDFYAPSAGLPFDLSLLDMQNHLLVLGGTGSGKTSGVLRPLAWQIAEKTRVGIVVMDGKAALPKELAKLPGMVLVDPAVSRFSLVAGLSPTEIVDTIADVLRPQGESDPYWADSAMGLLRRAAVIARHAGGEWWTLDGTMRIAATDEGLAAAKEAFPIERALEDPLLEEALLYFAYEWRNLDAKPKSSILSHARSWVTTITAHPDLLRWASTQEGEDSFDILTPLKGGRLGFEIPSYRYGRAGAVVTALLKARLYAALKARAEQKKLKPGETAVVFIIDEAQEVATRDDATMLSIGRSLHIAMVGATQTIEGVTDKLGEHGAAKWLAVYGNAIGLPGRSRKTDNFLAERAGSTWKARVTSAPGISVRDSITAAIFSGSVASARRQTTMREFASPAPSPIAPFLQQAQNAQANRQIASPDPRMSREGDTGIQSALQPHPLVVAEEMSTLLAEPNLALAITTRGRVPRRDVIKLTPRFESD
ncbi:MAG: type IV secretion system DNA-binding domain-containing protein [Fimbriimonas sp.]